MSDFFIADDLSGALDAAAAFHAAGRTVTVALSEAAWPEGGSGEIVAYTTETRNAAPAEAAAAVARAIAQGRARGGRLLYKKIDSTLRGPVAAELAAMLRLLPGTHVLFAPANPAVGRTVRNGVLRVHGIPVAETAFGRDAASPVTESEIRRLLGDIATARVIIPDVTTDAELAAEVARMDAAGIDWVGVGSGALARPIASQTTGDTAPRAGEGGSLTGSAGADRQAQPEESTGGSRVGSEVAVRDDKAMATPPRPPGQAAPPASTHTASSVPCLMVGGSAHAVNRQQAENLCRIRGVPVQELRPDTVSSATAAAIAAIRGQQGAALLIEERRHPDSAQVVRSIAAAVAEVVKATGIRRLFVTGGETAFALCPLLGVTTLTFRAEIESGLSLSSAETPGGRLFFAIKPGGFGDDLTWVRAWDALQVA